MVINKDAIAYKFEIKIKIQGSGIGPGLWSHYSYMIHVWSSVCSSSKFLLIRNARI